MKKITNAGKIGAAIFMSSIMLLTVSGVCFRGSALESIQIMAGQTNIKTEMEREFPPGNPIEPTGFVEWNKTFDSGYTDTGFCVQQVNDGGYIAVGHSLGLGIWLIKTDYSGNMEWDKYFDYNPCDHGWYVLQTTDGGYIILGETENKYVLLIKTDDQGNMEWDRLISGKMFSQGRSIQQTRDGGYIIAGFTSPMKWVQCYDAWLLKVDALGYEEWSQTFEREYYNRAYSVKQTPDDGYVIVGGKAITSDGNADIWLVKTDASGNLQWDKTFGDESTWNMGRCVQLTSDGGYITLGETLLIKTDADGNEIWSKPIGGLCVQQTTDDGYIITGYKEYQWEPWWGDTDLKLIKTDSHGNKEWTWIYGGTYRDVGNFVQQTTDEGYIVVGYKEFPFNHPVAQRDIWVIKTGKEPLLNDESIMAVSMLNEQGINQYIPSTVVCEQYSNMFPTTETSIGTIECSPISSFFPYSTTTPPQTKE